MKQTIYLAGGYRSNWQEKVEESVEAIIKNPRAKEYENDERVKMKFQEYSTWDFHQIKESNIVFAYFEKTNPSGIGAAIEVGYAYGLGKTVVTVLEKNNEHMKDRYLDFVKKASHIVFEDFESGLAFLKSLTQ